MDFSGLRFLENKARKLLKKFGENSEQNSGGNSGQKFEKFGELSFCHFSDLKLSVPYHPGRTYYQLIPQRQHFLFQPQTLPSPCLSGSWRGSLLSRFSVGFWLVLVIFDQK